MPALPFASRWNATRLAAVWACAALLGAVLIGGTERAAAAPPPPENLRLAISGPTGIIPLGDVTAFAVLEANQRQDLTGDGDQFDQVLHLAYAASGRVENTRHVLRNHVHSSVCRTGDDVAFVASEDGRADWNGDGDRTDGALHVWDLVTGIVRRDHRAADGGVACGGGHVAYRVSEPGEDRDHNGDGDRSDSVWHVYNTAIDHGRTLELSEFAALHGTVRMGAAAMVFTVHEPGDSRDYNGDGDTADRVLMRYDFVTQQETNYAVAGYLPAYERRYDAQALGRFVPVRVREAGQGAGLDANGDGDALDDVVFAADLQGSGNLVLGAAGYAAPSTTAWMTLFIDEAAEDNTDLNGDGDTSDHILVFQHALSGARFNTQRAVIGSPQSPPFLGSDFGVGVVGPRVAAQISELDSQLDLDGDGLMTRRIVQVFDPRFGTIHNTRVSSTCASNPEDVLVVGPADALTCTSESLAGADLNGDGDQIDHIAGAVRLSGTALRLTGLALDLWDPMLERGKTGYAVVNEASQGASLNGDGDTYDRVVHAFEPGSGASRNLALAVATFTNHDRYVWAAGSDALYVGVDELAQGQDLSNDGDIGDIVLHRLP